MKYITLLLAILVIYQTTTAQTVVRIIDGDTYKVFENGKFAIIRLANIDAPEISQYYGDIVKARVSKLILGRIVNLDVMTTDRYGRTVANLKIDGMSLDSILVVNGCAWHYLAYSHHPYLSSYEAQAEKLGVGMWACKHNIPPWIWRKLNNREKRLKEMCH